jgi:hypothetical protein
MSYKYSKLLLGNCVVQEKLLLDQKPFDVWFVAILELLSMEQLRIQKWHRHLGLEYQHA